MTGQELEPVEGQAVRTFTRGGRPLTPFGADPEDQLDAETEALYWEGVPESTRSIYTYQWRRFVAWCADDTLGPPHPVGSMPATPATVAKYIRAHMTWENREGRLAGRGGQPYAPDTVRLALAVISVAHKAHGLASPTGKDVVIRAMRGYQHRWSKGNYRRYIAYAPTPDEIIAMVNTCDLTTVAGLRDALLIRLQADCGRRNSELMDLDLADISFPTPYRMLITIRFSKTNQDGTRPDVIMVEADRDIYAADGKTIEVPAWHPETCPVVLAREYIQLSRQRGFETGPFFRKVAAGQRAKVGYSGRIRPERMDRKNYQDVITRCARAAGIDRDPVTGELREIVPHSMRAAFATNGSAAGVPLGLVCDQGGWSRDSPVVLKYQRAGNRWAENNPGRAIRAYAATHPDKEGRE